MERLTEDVISKFFKKLQNSKLIEREDVLFEKDDQFNFNIDEIKKIAIKAEQLRVNPSTGGLEYFDNGTWSEVPEMDSGIEKNVIFLKNRLPAFTFKTSPEFSDFKNSEIESIYIACNLSSLLGGEFKEELLDLIQNFNYSEIEEEQSSGKTFKNFVDDCQSLQSKTIQAIISASRQNISEKKEVYTSLNLSKLEKKERIEFESLKKEINYFFNNFKDEKLSPDKVKFLKKSEVYALYEERDRFIREEIINKSIYNNVRTFYFIDKLNYEDINVFHKKTIINASKQIVIEMCAGKQLSKVVLDEMINKLSRKGIKVYLRKWKNEELNTFLKDRINYYLPKKV
jgi:hypothetical protein